MRAIWKRAGVALVAGALVLGLAGCASNSAPTSDPSKGDNSLLAFTGQQMPDTQEFEKVTFGSYQGQDITWLKLAEQDGKTLLISECVLDAKPYYDGGAKYDWVMQSPRPTDDVSWEDSSLRTWLNGEFADAAFSGDQKGAIVEVTNSDTKNNAAHTADNGGDAAVHQTNDTKDKVFLLSVAEAKQYFNNDAARVAMPTDYAVKNGVYTGVAATDDQVDGAAVWWLRTNGYYSGYEAVVTDDGYVHGDGYRIDGELHDGLPDHGTTGGESTLGGNVGVRPCIWVDTSALS